MAITEHFTNVQGTAYSFIMSQNHRYCLQREYNTSHIYTHLYPIIKHYPPITKIDFTNLHSIK